MFEPALKAINDVLWKYEEFTSKLKLLRASIIDEKHRGVSGKKLKTLVIHLIRGHRS